MYRKFSQVMALSTKHDLTNYLNHQWSQTRNEYKRKRIYDRQREKATKKVPKLVTLSHVISRRSFTRRGDQLAMEIVEIRRGFFFCSINFQDGENGADHAKKDYGFF